MVPTSAVTDATERLARAIADLITNAAGTPAAAPTTWRERLWTCPADTRLGVVDVAEALGRSKQFIYRHTREQTIPFRRLDGELVFRAGDVRAWLVKQERSAR